MSTSKYLIVTKMYLTFSVIISNYHRTLSEKVQPILPALYLFTVREGFIVFISI